MQCKSCQNSFYREKSRRKSAMKFHRCAINSVHKGGISSLILFRPKHMSLLKDVIHCEVHYGAKRCVNYTYNIVGSKHTIRMLT